MTLDEYLDQAPAILEHTARTLRRDLHEAGVSRILDQARTNSTAVLQQIDTRARAEKNTAIPSDLNERREHLRGIVARIRDVNSLAEADALVDSIKSWSR